MATVLRTRNLLARPDLRIESGGLLIRGGEIVRLLDSPAAVTRAARREGVRPTDLGDGWVTPGLVDAHAHLELSGLAGAVGPRRMVPWVRRVVELRRDERPSGRARAAARGARALLVTGTTLVGDVDSTGTFARLPNRGVPRRVVFREALDAGEPERRGAVLADLRRALPRRALLREGLSPHAPHTVSPEFLADLASLARRRRLPVQVHWSETAEEVLWLRSGSGPFGALLGVSPRCPGLDLLEAAGLLGPATSLVHGNHPLSGEPARLARAGVVLVHCPGSHAFFGRPPFPLARYRRAGVTLALGTDSLASNERLDMRREMALLRRSHGALSPRFVWAAATTGGARALGAEGRAGELRPGALADLALFDVRSTRLPDVLDELTADAPAVRETWVGGRRTRLPASHP